MWCEKCQDETVITVDEDGCDRCNKCGREYRSTQLKRLRDNEAFERLKSVYKVESEYDVFRR